METREQFVEDLKKKLDGWNEQIGKTEAKLNGASDEARAKYQTQLAEMTAHAADAQKRMQALAETSASEWEKQRSAFDAAWGDIAAGFGRAWSRF